MQNVEITTEITLVESKLKSVENIMQTLMSDAQEICNHLSTLKDKGRLNNRMEMTSLNINIWAFRNLESLIIIKLGEINNLRNRTNIEREIEERIKQVERGLISFNQHTRPEVECAIQEIKDIFFETISVRDLISILEI